MYTLEFGILRNRLLQKKNLSVCIEPSEGGRINNIKRQSKKKNSKTDVKI